MRKILIVLVLFIAFGCNRSEKYVIHGTILGDVTEEWVYMERIMDDENAIIDSVPIVNGEFTFSGRVGFPEVYGISYHMERSKGIAVIFVEPGELKVTIDDNNWFMGVTVEGGKVNDGYAELTQYRMEHFVNKIYSLNEELATAPHDKQDSLHAMIAHLMEEDYNHAIAFVTNNPTSPMAIYHLLYYYSLLPEDQLKEILFSFSEDIKQTVIYQSLVEEMGFEESVAELPSSYVYKESLVPFPLDFNDASVSEALLGLSPNKGVVIDIWGTWCGACLSHMPDIKELSQEIEDSFTFVYLSVRSPKEKWTEYIAENQLLGYHFLVKDDVIKRLGKELDMNIRALPSYLVFDRHGNLLNQNSPNLKLDELVALVKSN